MYIPRLYAESRSLKQTRQPRLTEPGERMKRVFLDQPADNKRGQDGLIPQLYARAPTQTTFVPITGYFPVKSPNKRQPLSLCLFLFFSNGAERNTFAVSVLSRLILAFVNLSFRVQQRERRGGGTQRRDKSEV